MGIGNGCLFIPAVATVPTYFSSKRGLATGVAASGSSLGGVIYPVLFHKLEPQVGFAWATRTIAFIMLAMMLIVISILKVRAIPTKPRPMLDLAAFKNKPYAFYAVSSLFGFAGVYVPFFYIQQYATDRAATDSDLSFYTLSLMNGLSIIGRVLPGLVADRIGTLNTLLATSLCTSILGLCWLAIHNTAGILVFSSLYGFFSGTFVSLQAAVIATMCPKYYLLGTWMGMMAFVSGLGLLMGNPVAGQILADGSWEGVQAYCGASVFIATLAVLGARISKAGCHFMVKA